MQTITTSCNKESSSSVSLTETNSLGLDRYCTQQTLPVVHVGAVSNMGYDDEALRLYDYFRVPQGIRVLHLFSKLVHEAKFWIPYFHSASFIILSQKFLNWTMSNE